MQVQMKQYSLEDERKRADADLHEVPGFEGYYCATEDGRVWSCGRWVGSGDGERYKWGEWLKRIRPNSRGYLTVVLSVDGERYNTNLGEVVSLTFYGEHPDNLTVHYIDGDRTNCHIDNLTWEPIDPQHHRDHSVPLRRRAA